MGHARPRGPLFGWRVPAITVVAGVVVGAGLAGLFVLLHSNWKQMPWVTPDAESTVPYWVVAVLILVAVSVGLTGLILHGRGHPRWFGLSAALAVVEIALVLFSMIPIAVSGNGGLWAANVGWPILTLAALAGPIVSMVWRLKSAPVNIWPHIGAAVVLPCALYASFTSASYALQA